MTAARKPGPPAAKKAGRKRRPAQRARAAGEPKTAQEVAALVARAGELLMRHGVKACLKDKIPAAIILMASTEQVGYVASMMNLPYPQALQAACNGVESVYRAAAPEQVAADRPIDQVTEAMVQRGLAPAETRQGRCELGKGGTPGG